MIAAALTVIVATGPLIEDRLVFDDVALEQLATSWNTVTTLEMLMMPATVSNVDGMGFAKPDDVRLSVFGDSNTQTRWSINGIDMSDPLHAGGAAIRVPFTAIGAMRLRFSESADSSLGSGVEYDLVRGGPKLRATTRVAFPRLGGISAGAVPVFEAIARHPHPLSVSPGPASERRRFIDNTSAALLIEEGAWLVSTDVDTGTRRFIRYALEDYAGVFDEQFVLASAVARYQHRAFELVLGVDYKYRENAGAEHFYGEEETFARHAFAVFAGLSAQRLKVGLTAKIENDSAGGIGFTRELHDLDGQALWPFSARGTRMGVGLDATYEQPIASVTNAFVHLGQRGVAVVPSVRAWSNPLVLDGSPLGRYDFTARPSFYAYGQIEAGLRDTRKLGAFHVGYSFYGALSHMFGAGRPPVSVIDVGIKAYAQWRRTRWFMPFLAVARTPVAFTQNQAEAIDPNVLNRSAFAGDELYDTSGGASIDAVGPLAMPKTHSASFGWQTQLSQQWRLDVFALGKTFDNTLWLRFSSPDATVAGSDRAYLTPGEKRYSLVNYPFPETPFYLGAHVQLTGSDRDRYVFTLGGSAYYSLGSTAFGFGPLANDVGVLDTSMANPNTRRYREGNLEGDRAYYLKLGLAVRIVHTLWAALGIRYRDGRPFTFIDWSAQNGQAQPAYSSPKGSLYHLDGPRESGRVNIDLRVSYTIPLQPAALRLSFLVWNVFDLGAAISERQLYGGDSIRSSAELEVPRAAMLTGELLFD